MSLTASSRPHLEAMRLELLADESELNDRARLRTAPEPRASARATIRMSPQRRFAHGKSGQLILF